MTTRIIQAELSDRTTPRLRLRRILALGFAVWGGPAAWILQLVLNYAFAQYPCMPNDVPLRSLPDGWGWDPILLYVINAIALAVALAAGFSALSMWRRPLERAEGPEAPLLETTAARIRFLAGWGVLTGFGFFVAIAFDTIALIGTPQCSG